MESAGNHESPTTGHDELFPGGPDVHGEGGHAHRSPESLVWQLIVSEKKDVGIVILFGLGVGLLTLATPIAVQGLVNSVAFGGLLQPILVLAVILFTCLAFAAALTGLQWWLVEILQRRIFVRVVATLAQRLPRVCAEAFDRINAPELVNRFFEVVTIQKVTASLLLDGVALALQSAVSMSLLAFYHPYLLGFDVLLLVTMAVLVFGLGRRGVSTSIAESRAKYAVAGWLEEMVLHPVAFKSSGGQDYAIHRADKLAEVYLSSRRDHFRVLFRQVGFALVAQVLTSTLLLGLGGWLVIQGQLTLGQLVASELLVAVIVGAFAKIGKHLDSYYDLVAAVDKLRHLVDLPIEPTGGEVRSVIHHPASLRICDLAYEYRGYRPVFTRLNWQIESGDRVVVSAPAGSGKSTLVELLFGMRHPTRGHIELDGIDLRDLSLDSLRQQVALVKTVEIFPGTVFENVQLGRSSVQADDVRAALEAVGLLEDIQSLKEGLGTKLTINGAPLSASQATRLMIARAMAGKPRLLVLDEAIDPLGDEDRERVMQAVFDRRRPWTLLVFTRREETEGHANRIFRLEPSDGFSDPTDAPQLPAKV